MADSSNDGGIVSRFFGGLLMAVGVLIGGLGGLCTAGFIGLMVMSTVSTSSAGGVLGNAVASALLCLAIGSIPMVTGGALFLLGRSLWRSAGPGKS